MRVLLLQKFDFDVKDQIGIENQVAKFLTRLKEETMIKLGYELKIDDHFLDEWVLGESQDLIL